MTFTTEPCHPHLSPPPPSPTCQQPWDGGRFWCPPPRASRLCLSQFSSHLPLSLSLPSSPSGPTGHWFSLSGRPLAAPSLSKEVCPPGLGDPQMMRGPGSWATAFSHHGLGSAAADGHRRPGPSMSTQRRERVPSVCHHLRGRGPGSHPSPACARHYSSSSRGPFPRGSSPLRPTLLAPGAPR